MPEETPPGGIEPGTELGGYRFTRLLGRGGMGAVYEAEQLSLERRVALKVISPELSSSASFRTRFAQEARVAASLDHPAVLPVYETGQLPDARLFIAMRLVHGVDLETRLRAEGRLAPVEAVEILAQVGEALDAAHAAGVIHRDVKPANVILEQRPAGLHAWLADFGLAKRLEGAPRNTATGQLVGTVDYMAPEQIEGRELTSRVDVYAFGCMVYRTLTGDVPFRRETDAATLLAHINAPPPLPSQAVAGLPAALDTLVARAMEKEPARRAASAGALSRWVVEQMDSGRVRRPAITGADQTAPPGARRRGRGRARVAIVAHVIIYAPVWTGAYILGRSL